MKKSLKRREKSSGRDVESIEGLKRSEKNWSGESWVKEKLKKKRERIWWRYGERSKGQVRRTGQSRVKEWR